MRTSTHFAIPLDIESIITMLHTHRFQAFIVGGCVRDSLLGLAPRDWDIATNATPKQIQTIFAKDYTLITLGERFGTITLLPHKTNDTRTPTIEITTFRLESTYSNNRHPSHIIYTNNLLQDLMRRDFTCNALAYNPHLHKQTIDSSIDGLYHHYIPYIHDGICDYVNGLEDIATRTLKAVGDANTRFSEDALRILRTLRLQAQLGFTLESNTHIALLANAKQLCHISAERKQEEWSKILYTKHFMRAILGYGAVWAWVFSEFAQSLISLDSHPSTHFLTTIATLESLNIGSLQCTSTPLESIDPDSAISLRLSLWFHALNPSKHAALQARKSLQALRYKSRIIALCGLLLDHIDLPDTLSLESTRLLAKDIGLDSLSLLCVLLSLLHSDSYANLCNHIATIRAHKLCYNLATLALNGNDIIAISHSMGINLLGSEIGKLLHSVLDAVIHTRIQNTKPALYAHAKNLIQSLYSPQNQHKD